MRQSQFQSQSKNNLKKSTKAIKTTIIIAVLSLFLAWFVSDVFAAMPCAQQQSKLTNFEKQCDVPSPIIQTETTLKSDTGTKTAIGANDDNAKVSNEIFFNTVSHREAAKFLGWVSDKISVTNLCEGYYAEPESVAKYPNPSDFSSLPTTITASDSILFSQRGTSTLKGDVTINQSGRQILADKAIFYRDAKTEKISAATLTGKVRLREAGKIIVANSSYWDFGNKHIIINNGMYRMLIPAPTGVVSSWGQAYRGIYDRDGVLRLLKATYTTCSPVNNSWKLKGSNVILDKNSGRGTIKNAVLVVRDVPILYLPYVNFPIDKKRKSGFLYPSFGYSGKNGVDVSIPYYFNLAPNYDVTIVPRVITNRGVLTQGQFRYLTENSKGIVDVRYIPNDSVFAKDQANALSTYQSGNMLTRSLLSRLQNANTNRGFFSYQNQTKFNQHWSSNVNLRHTTDDYFFQDFGSTPIINNDQLLNQADIAYAGENWNFSALTQIFQTLRPINSTPVAQEQYRRVPQLDFKGELPNTKHGFDYQMTGQFVFFDYDHKYDSTTNLLKATGSRINLMPSISLPINLAGAYLIPRVQLHSTLYSLRNNVVTTGGVDKTGRTENSISRVSPIASLDSGAFFNRITSLFGNNYTQTLEPRFFYLLVPTPKQQQDYVPIFDSSLVAFDFDQLFVTNRFSGYDLVGDANQVSAAVTTRFLDSYTAEEKVRLSIGQMYAFKKHAVCLNGNCQNDPLAQHNLAPTVAQIKYNLNLHWSAEASVAWNASARKVNNSALTFRYAKGPKRIISAGYNFVQNGDNTSDTKLSNNLSRINLAVAWPVIRENINLVANWNYNISHDHPQEYFYGVEYQSCCWAFRVVQSRIFIGTDPNRINKFQQATYLQIVLKGLGGVGTSNASSMLTSRIPGYNDSFNL